jgi:hypothetical protein
VILSLAAAPNGDLWVGTPDGLSRIRGNKVDTFTSADGLPDDFVRSLLIDTDGSLWIGTRRGLAHWAVEKSELSRSGSGAGMETFTQANGLGSDLVGAMARLGAGGDLWVATFAGLSRLHGGKISNFTTADGPLEQCGHGSAGARRWDAADRHAGSRLEPVGRAALFACRGQRDGLEPDHDPRHSGRWRGHLWFATGTALRAATAMGPAAWPPAARTGWSLGLRMGCAAGRRRPTAILRRGARATGASGLPRPRGWWKWTRRIFRQCGAAAGGHWSALQVDDVDAAAAWSGVLGLSPDCGGARALRVRLRGLSFVAPQKVRYRYMLEGFDRGWTEAGTRRTAYYTNIPPGTYTFRVQAANNDGLWNTEGAALSFELRPHFYQTSGFMRCWWPLAVVAILVLLRRRLMRAEREFRPCWASATGSRARFTTRWRRGTLASRCNWRCWRSCCA